MKLVRISIQISLNNEQLNPDDMDEVYSLKINCATISDVPGRRVIKLRGRVKDKPNIVKLVRISNQRVRTKKRCNTDDIDEVNSLKIDYATNTKPAAAE